MAASLQNTRNATLKLPGSHFKSQNADTVWDLQGIAQAAEVYNF